MGIHLVVNVEAGLFLHLSSRTLPEGLMLVEFSFGEPEFVPDFDYQHLRLVSVENNGTAYGFVLLDLEDDLPGVDADAGRRILGQLSQKLISNLLPIFGLTNFKHNIDVVVEGFFSLVGQPVGILEFLCGKIDDKFGEDDLEDILFVSKLIHGYCCFDIIVYGGGIN